MPIFDLKCPRCGGTKLDVLCKSSDEQVKCPCGAVMSHKPSLFRPDCFPQDGLFLEHVSSKGKRFYSRKEMRDYEKETGTWIDCLH